MNESGGRSPLHSEWARVHELPIFGRPFQRLYGRRSTSDDMLHVIEISGTNETLVLDGAILMSARNETIGHFQFGSIHGYNSHEEGAVKCAV